MSRNHTQSSVDEQHGNVKNNRNIRHQKTDQAVTGLKAKYFGLFNKCEDEKSYFETKKDYMAELKNEMKGVKL